MTDATLAFRRMARNNRLANLRLHAAIAALQPGEFAAPRTSFFPSIKATLNHILVIDRFYIDALEGGDLGPAAWTVPEPYDAIAPLSAEQAALDERLLAICEHLDASVLSAPVRIHRQGRVQVETVGDTLLHLSFHDTHHRGQVHAMLSGTSIKPPQLDEFFMTDDARFRTGELARLGWSEADLTR